MGGQYTLVDGHMRVFYRWGARNGFSMNELSADTAWRERMLKRPTVRKIVEAEQNVLTQSLAIGYSLTKNGRWRSVRFLC